MSTTITTTRRAGGRIRSAALRLAIALAMVVAGAYLALGATWREAFATLAAGDTALVTDQLNVRSGPGLGYPLIARLDQGRYVAITGESIAADGYDWVPLASPVGWVAQAYLGAVDATAVFTPGDRVFVDADALNMRVAPGTGSAVLQVLPAGTLLAITGGPAHGNGYAWYEVKTHAASGGESGWVIGPALARAPAEMPDPAVAFDAGGTVHVATDSLRLRGGPGTSAPILAELPDGTTLTVTGGPVGAEGYTWYSVRTVAGASGWVAERYLAGGPGRDAFEATGIAPGAPALVDAASLNVRAGPGLAAPVNAQLLAGTWLMVVAGPVDTNGYHWYQVDTANGLTGWVIGEALIPTR